MQTVHRSFRLPVSLDRWMKQYRDETGVPTAIFVRRLIEAAREQHGEFSPMRPSPKSRKPRKAG